MPLSQYSTTQHSILVVVVLYKRAPSESQSLCSLIRILEANYDLAQHFSLIVYDNSPQPQNVEEAISFPFLYRHDPTNAGLPAAYNFALTQAEEKQCQWLLLLDQDTTPTCDFLKELLASTIMLRAREDVASIVPKLLVNGKIYSPAAHFIDQLRHQYRRSNHAVSHDTFGVQPGRLGAYNSGAALRVSALQSIGGFPGEFWLDYLDHAVFHALSIRDYRMYVMRTEIDHDSSQASLSSVPVWRQRNILLAQILFVKKTGNFFDRLLYRVWLLRHTRILWILHPDRRLWKEALLQALLLKTGTNKILKS
jgi:GT2 family glycosyltransferase